MTTIDIQVNMTSRNPDSFRVRIVRDETSEDADLMTTTNSPRMSRSSAKKLVNREKSAGDLIKSPAKRLKNQSNSIDVSEMFYNSEQFTITAYLPNEEMDGEKQKRLKIPCYSGMTVQQVIENYLPHLISSSYLVYQFPSKALLNPERDASVLKGQEIWIEPTRLEPQEEISDRRLAVVKELYRTEDAFLEHLRNIFDVYMEPLSTCGISQTDMNTLFLPLSRLCDLLMNFYSELELAVRSWNTHTTLIGGIFKQYHSFWDMYVEYAQNYTVAMRLLKAMRTDDSFNKFLDTKRGAAMHTLESLMLLPVQRISDYNRYLSQLLSLTSRDHRDYQNIRLTLARTEEIIQARADELVYLQNESKLEQVQLQFPNDALDMFEKKRSYSSAGFHRHSGSQKTSKSGDTESTDSLNPKKNLRMYIQEGPVKLTIITLSKHIEQERYLFLFSDLLLIAKPKAGRTQQHRCYRLKKRLKLGEMWVAPYDPSYSQTQHPECSFIVGWPLDSSIAMNCIATFRNEALKSLWYGHISKHIMMQRKLCISDSISAHILNMTKSSTPSTIPEFIGLNVSDTVQDVIHNALDSFDIREPVENFQLWVKLSKEDREEVLHGFESPFAIQDHHVSKVQNDQSGTDLKPQQLEFILKRRNLQQSTSNSRSSTSIFKFRKRPKTNRYTKPDKGIKMFGVPLDQLIINNQLPEKLQEILVRLWVDAPSTFGIFRQSPSIKKIREIREGIDENEPVDLSDVSLHVIGAILKDLLRNVPGGVIPSARYTEFVATNDIREYDLRIQKIRIVLTKLPFSNQIFLRYLLPLLSHISDYEAENRMSTTNLAICFAPSLLEPDCSLSVIKNEAPTLVDFMITNSPEIYNHEIPDLFKQVNGPVDHNIRYSVPLKDEDDTEMSEPFYSSSHNRGNSMDMCTSASEDSLDEDEMSPRRAPLLHTSSDTNVPEILNNSGRGRVTLLSDRSEEVSTGIEGDQSDLDEEYEDEYSPQRSVQPHYLRARHGSGDSTGRRRTIGTQNSIKQYYSPDVNPMARLSPYGQGYPSKYVDSMDSDATGISGNRSEPSATRQANHKKKKRKPGHSNSFSKTSDLQHNEARLPQSSSLSFGYDERQRSLSVAIANRGVNLTHEESLTKSLEHTVAHNSNQSINSRTSGSSNGSQSRTRHSNTPPLLSGRPTNDPLVQSSNRADDIKTVISNRFGLLSSSGIKPTGTVYDSDVSQDTLIPNEEDYDTQKITRPPPNVDYTYKDEYPTVRSTETMKRVESVETTTSIDDRPEAERHLSGGGSLPRISTDDYKHLLNTGGSLGRKGPFGEIVPLGNSTVENGSRLTIISGGYNSDTESSPSRTLSRQEKKLQEVSSPQTLRSSIPSRYSKQFETGASSTVNETKKSPDRQKGTESSQISPLESRSRSSTVSQSTFSNQSTDLGNNRRSRSSTINNGATIQATIPEDKQETATTKSKRSSTYEVYQKLYEKESTKSTTSDQNGRKLSSSLEVTPTRPSIDESNVTVNVGSKILSVPSAGRDSLKSRSMPDYTKKSVTRTLTATANIKTVKVVRYDLPTPKRIRRINLRAYNTNK